MKYFAFAIEHTTFVNVNRNIVLDGEAREIAFVVRRGHNRSKWELCYQFGIRETGTDKLEIDFRAFKEFETLNEALTFLAFMYSEEFQEILDADEARIASNTKLILWKHTDETNNMDVLLATTRQLESQLASDGTRA